MSDPNQVTIRLNRASTERLKAIADYYGNTNLRHQLNLIINSLHSALELDGQFNHLRMTYPPKV